ncbi:ead/Ea22-like family protein, partial [Chromobacterium violaceum]
MLTPDQLAALRAAAEAATPGPWEHQTSNGWHRVGTTPANRGRVDGDVVASGAASPADMAHIAAANPAAVQGLLADLEAMAQELLAYRADSSLDT